MNHASLGEATARPGIDQGQAAGSATILTAASFDVGGRGVTTIKEGLNHLAVLSVAGIVAVIEHLDDGPSIETQHYAGIVPESFLFLDAVAGFHQVPPCLLERHLGRVPLRMILPPLSVDQASRPHDCRPHTTRLLDPPDLRLLRRLQLPHEAHVAALEDQGGAGLGGEDGAGAAVLTGSGAQGSGGKQGSEATQGAIECAQGVACGDNFSCDATLARFGQDVSSDVHAFAWLKLDSRLTFISLRDAPPDERQQSVPGPA